MTRDVCGTAEGNHGRHVRTRYILMRNFHPLASPMQAAAAQTAAPSSATLCASHGDLGLAGLAPGSLQDKASDAGGAVDAAQHLDVGSGAGSTDVSVSVCVVDAALDVRMGSRFHTTSERTIAICAWLRSLVYALSPAPCWRSAQDNPGADAGACATSGFPLGVVVLQNVFAQDSRSALTRALGGYAPSPAPARSCRNPRPCPLLP